MPKRHSVDDLLKKGEVMKGSDKKLVIERIPTGIPELDKIINGGIPRRRMTVLVGSYSSGKTLLTQFIIKAAMEKGLEAVYVDTEQTYDPEWWAACGVPLENLRVSQPSNGSAAVRVAVASAQAGVDIIVVDSLAALYPKERAEGDVDKNLPGFRAQLINRMCEAFLAVKPDGAMIFINQVRDSFGNMPTPMMNSMPGGRGLQHYSGLILRVLREGWINDSSGKHTGFNIKVIVSKSKVGTPFGECVLPFHFRGEIDMLAMLVERALEAGIITQNGPWYTIQIGDKPKVSGKNSVLQMLASDEKLRGLIEAGLGDF